MLSTGRRTPSIHSFLDDYLVQFEIAAGKNRWSTESMAHQLCIRLRGPAVSILNDLSSCERLDYRELVSKLKARFQPGNQAQLSRSSLKVRLRRPRESIIDLGDDIKRLSRKTYPGMPDHLREELAIGHFQDSLNDHSLKLFVELRKPKTVDEAINSALKCKWSLNGHSVRLTNENQPRNDSDVLAINNKQYSAKNR